jgi:hypothetical protein
MVSLGGVVRDDGNFTPHKLALAEERSAAPPREASLVFGLFPQQASARNQQHNAMYRLKGRADQEQESSVASQGPIRQIVSPPFHGWA